MKSIDNYITEKILINKRTFIYTCYPKTRKKLREILEERLAEDKNADLNDIDVSQIKDMSAAFNLNIPGLFEDLDPHNIDISKWNVSNVTNMDGMFFNCKNFNCDLSQWDVSNVTHMANMFFNCNKFNSDLSQWDVSNVTNMFYMFRGCHNFNCDLNDWNIHNLEDYTWIFHDCPLEKNPPKWYKK